MSPAVVIRPRRPLRFVNQSWSSGPTVIVLGSLTPVAVPPKVVMSPDGVTRPMRSLPVLVNQRLPSGPAAVLAGNATSAVVPSDEVISPDGGMRPVRPAAVV